MKVAFSEDHWIHRGFEMFCNAAVETRIRAKAAKLAAESRRLRTAGLQVPLLEVDDLINHVWLIALKTRPDFPDHMGMVLYFWRRMENHFKDKCRKAPAARTYVLSMEAEPEGVAQADRVLSLDRFRQSQFERDSAEALRGFHDYLEVHNEELLPLLRLVTVESIFSPRDQSTRLGLPIRDVYRLRAALALQAERFASGEDPAAAAINPRAPLRPRERVSYSPIFRLFVGSPPLGAKAVGRMDGAMLGSPALSFQKVIAAFRGEKAEDDAC